MDFALNDDQEALRDGARDVLDGLASSTQVRAVVEADGGWDPALWAAMVEQGWPGVAVPEALGGLGLGTVEVAVLLEEVGRHVAPAPVATTVLALDALARAGDEERVAAVLGGETVAAVAWSRRGDAVRAEPDGAGWRLHGRPDPVLYAPSAALVIVVADAPDGPALFRVELDRAHPVRGEPAMDRTRELGWLHFDGTAATRLGGRDAVEDLLDRGATYAAAELLGGADRALAMAVEYAKERVQFGRPIGSFQAIKHRCADMLVDVEGMRSSVYWAAWCISADHPDASVAASTAKVWCSDASKRVMASALQVHGGIGFTWEHDLHLFMKRAQLDQLTFGDASYHRERLASLLRPRVEAGESIL
ncbi:MAG TPA: acyl-CoA dehydrogenase family protein [Acidimicrobiia bacterium]|nr:acyl-CoA dehydrogenase family protein [Acidimicrobiia bacterium]